MIFGKNVNKYYLRYLWMYVLGLLALILVDYMQLKVPEFYRLVVNGINNGVVTYNGEEVAFDLDFLFKEICYPLLIVVACMIVGRFAWRVTFFGAGINVEADLRHRMFDKAKDLSRQYYHDTKVGHMMSLFTNDLQSIHESFGDGVLMACDAICLGAFSYVKMWKMSGVLSLLILIPIAFLFLAGLLESKMMEKKWDERQQAYSDLSDHSQETFSGIAVVKAFVKETVELLAFHKLNEKNEKTNIDYTRAQTLLNICISLSIESVICVILGYGGYLVYTKVFDAGMLVEFIAYFLAVVWPIMAVSELISMSAQGKASLARINEMLDKEPLVKDANDVLPIEKLQGKIEFRNLTYRHIGRDYDILSNVSFTIEKGERVGIIGRTGCGKTTIADLLMRIYNVPENTILLDDIDINKLSLACVRSSISCVPQDNFLFSTTIANNIAFSKEEENEEEIKNMAVLADVAKDIEEFPEQYQTILGERGVTVSGGQKQRISIARAMLKESSILILDDAVSAVDTATERKILDNLAKTGKNQTLLMIAHRISTVEGLDKIIFLEEGKVTAVGPHDVLYNSCPSYKKMVDLQKLEEGKEDSINA